jgi:hypothetical protein
MTRDELRRGEGVTPMAKGKSMRKEKKKPKQKK